MRPGTGVPLEPANLATVLPERSLATVHPEQSLATVHPERSLATVHPERSLATVHPERSRGALLAAGYASARTVTLHHARSFSLASLVLFGARRRAAYAVYAFCRRLDDLVDEGGAEGAALQQALADAHATIDAVFTGAPVPAVSERIWPGHELAAFRDTATRFALPAQPFHDLVLGMEMDLSPRRYATWAELDLYCYRVAGTVGLMMAPLLGCANPIALGPAADLGHAMQLTNILRDVAEDLGRGRLYLPTEGLAAHGLSEADLRRGVVDDRFRALALDVATRARALYASADRGLPFLGGFGSRALVRLMRSLYGGILDVLEARGFDVFRGRAFVPRLRKLALVARSLLWPFPSPPLRSLP